MLIIYLIFLILLLGVATFVAAILVLDVLTSRDLSAPFVSVPQDILSRIVDEIEVVDEDVVYDLGCGKSNIIKELANKNQNAEVIGVEKSLVPYFLSKFRVRMLKNVKILRQDFFVTYMGRATKIFLYLSDHAMNKLLPKFQKECRPGTKIISVDFKFPGLTPIKTVETSTQNKLRGKKIFIYEL